MKALKSFLITVIAAMVVAGLSCGLGYLMKGWSAREFAFFLVVILFALLFIGVWVEVYNDLDRKDRK